MKGAATYRVCMCSVYQQAYCSSNCRVYLVRHRMRTFFCVIVCLSLFYISMNFLMLYGATQFNTE